MEIWSSWSLLKQAVYFPFFFTVKLYYVICIITFSYLKYSLKYVSNNAFYLVYNCYISINNPNMIYNEQHHVLINIFY